ncbi:hypothetical protein GGP55_003113 [Salinibacter ruber]|uniref:sulfotransferase family protein n=1 Tax=Salinibacter ruber TaxID=146919 RepID=UPI0021699EB8|nr:sulfotransferase domain-containing protein [Salinibacter ruber]MCS3632495.1 hypothetical protein [Salinibacter ruber]
MLPDFIIVGTAKSGTSTLAHHLRQHPDIYMPSADVHFFYESGKGKWGNGVQWYKEQFQAADSGQIIGEKTPTYSYLPSVAKRIHDVLPGVKLIWLFRNPIDRAYSNYWHVATYDGKEYLSFEQAIKREAKRSIGKKYLRRSKYCEQVGRYLEHFSKEQMHFIVFEELKNKPKSVLSDLLQFLDVDSDYAKKLKPDTKKNSTNIPRSILINYISRCAVRKSPILRPVMSRIVRKLNQMLNRRWTPGYPEMDQELRERLEDHFKPYNRQLERQTGLDLSVWS